MYPVKKQEAQMKNSKMLKILICINIIVIALFIIATAEANTTITRTQNIIVRTKDKESAKKLKANLDKRIMESVKQ